MESINSSKFKAGLIAAYQNLEDNKELVNSLNVFPVPDGDTGTNMSLTMKSVYGKVQASNDNIKSLAKALSTGSLMGARGNSGVILSQLCRGVTLVVEHIDEITVKDVALACDKARETAYKAVLKPTEGTILTVSRMMAEFAMANYKKYKDVKDFLEDIVIEGNRALDMTPEMLPVLKQAGVVDSGGKGLMVLMEGFLSAITGKAVIREEKKDEEEKLEFEGFEDIHEFESPEDIKFGYCTEFFIHHDGSQNYEDWREFISDFGDSIVCVGDEEMIKTHIHTDHPGKVLELALERGYLTGLKIENMREQFSEVQENKKGHKSNKKEEKKPFGFVTISIGEGFDDVFKDLGVDEIISGGQTMNPATQDIVDATKKINADVIYVFPNNKNIILTAKQAIELIDDKKIIVIETRSIPEAFTALMHFDETESEKENTKNMTDSLEEVRTIELTYAVRDTKVGDLEIKKDDIIGINEKDIVASGKDVNLVMLDLIKKSVDEYSGLLILYYGQEMTQEEGEKLLDLIEKEDLDLEVELVYGGQPLYYYIASIE